MRQPFDGMDINTRRFYLSVFNNAILNLYAVKHNLFDTILCETTDPAVTERWHRALPSIIEQLGLYRGH